MLMIFPLQKDCYRLKKCIKRKIIVIAIVTGSWFAPREGKLPVIDIEYSKYSYPKNILDWIHLSFNITIFIDAQFL